MEVIQIFIPNSLRNFNNIIFDTQTKEAYSVDPLEASLINQQLEEKGLKLKGIINTHYHFDHIRHNEKLANEHNVEILKLAHGDIINFSEGQLKVIATPGHVDDHVVFLGLGKEGEQKFIISGDTIFNAGVGNCKNGGDPHILFETTQMLNHLLEDDVILYPSHDYFLTNLKFSLSVENSNQIAKQYLQKRKKMNLDEEFILTTMGEERMYNPFFRLEELKSVMNKDNLKETFLALRAARDVW